MAISWVSDGYWKEAWWYNYTSGSMGIAVRTEPRIADETLDYRIKYSTWVWATDSWWSSTDKWIYHDGGGNGWGWSAVTSGTTTYFTHNSDYDTWVDNGYWTGYAYEYYYWPSTPTSYSSSPEKTYTFYPDDDLASSTYGDLGDFSYTSASGNVSLKKTVNGTTTTVQTASYSITDTYTHKGWCTSKPSSITASSQVDLEGTFYFSNGDSLKSFYAVFDNPTSSTSFSNNVVNSITDPSNYTDTDTKYILSFSDEYNTHSDKTATVTKTYSFTQWNDSDGTEVTFPITFTSDTTITAQYSLSNIQYQSVILPKPTKTNYIFEGWKDSSGNLYAGGTSYEVKSTHTLTAQWTLNQVTITLKNNKNWTGNYAPTGGGTYKAGTLITINQPMKDGYHFVKWADNSNNIISNKASFQYTITGAITLTSYVEPNKFYIQYNANGGIGTMGISTHTYGVSSTLYKNKFTKDGYVFAGWAYNKDTKPKDVDFKDGANMTDIIKNDGEQVYLYAIWRPYTMTYICTARFSNDGKTLQWIPAVKYVYATGLTPPEEEPDDLTIYYIDENGNYYIDMDGNYYIHEEYVPTRQVYMSRTGDYFTDRVGNYYIILK